MKTKILAACLALSLAESIHAQQIEVITTSLRTPQKFVLTPRGDFLVSETSPEINQGRVSFVTRGGVRRSLLDNLPSGTEVTGGPSGPTALAIRDGRTLYVAIGGGDAERRGSQPGTSVWNPTGMSSPLFASVLEFRFSNDMDVTMGPFSLTPQQQNTLAGGDEVVLDDGAGNRVLVSLLAAMRMAVPDPNSIYRFSNPWGLEVGAERRFLYMADASSDSLVRIDMETGQQRRLMSFGKVQNPGPGGPPVLDSVPTSVRMYGNQLLVSFLTGFPFVPGNSRVLAVNLNMRTSEPFIYGLTSATDVAWRPAPNRPQFFVLEFSQNQTATPPGPGRLLRFDTQSPTVVTSDLRAPVAMQLDPQGGNTVYVLELTGRLVAVTW